MIFGRPTNLWLGFLTLSTGLVGLVAASLGHPIEPAILTALVGVEGAAVLLVAYQPPTLSPGDTFHVQTEAGQPNYQTTVAPPPAADPPPVKVPG